MYFIILNAGKKREWLHGTVFIIIILIKKQRKKAKLAAVCIAGKSLETKEHYDMSIKTFVQCLTKKQSTEQRR